MQRNFPFSLSQKQLRNVKFCSWSIVPPTDQPHPHHSSDGSDTAEQAHFTSHLTSEHNTAMEKTISTVLLMSSVCGGVWEETDEKVILGQSKLFGIWEAHYVYVNKTWAQAQKFCRDHYTDLSSISSEWEEEQLIVAGGWLYHWICIGLYREPYNLTGWR